MNTIREGTDTLVGWLIARYKNWEGVKQFQGTSDRLVKLYSDLCWTPQMIKMELEEQVKVFENEYDEMVISRRNSVWVLCPHHLLPVHLKVSIGFIPNGKVLGLSKFTRIATIMGKRPIMQEQYSMELADFLYTSLGPKGVAVYIEGVHGCMASRGVQQEVQVVTSKLVGAFLDEPSTKAEFLQAVR